MTPENATYSAKALRDLRIKHALSLSELSALSGVSRSALCNAETGRTLPQPRIRRRIAAALGVDVAELVASNS